MQISGINKFTMIDFPGKVACVIFTPGCNFRCPFCHNPEFVLPELLKNSMNSLIGEEALLNFLEKRKGMLEGVSICGGEPTLQKDLYDFCKKLKEIGYAVKLDTNGRNPEIIKKLIEDNLVDYVAMDIKNSIGNFSKVVGIKVDETPYLKSINILLNSNIDYEFRTTIIKNVHTKEDIENITKYISGAKNYFLQNFKPGTTLNPDCIGESFSKQELKEFLNIALSNLDKVEIRD